MHCAMVMKRKLVLLAFIFSCLMGIYVLCLNLESRPSTGPLGRLYHFAWSFGDFETPEVTVVDHPTEKPLKSDEHKPEEHKSDEHKPEEHKSDEHKPEEHKPEKPTETLRNVSKPGSEEGPTKAIGPTEPPYVGDRYASEDFIPQTNCPESIRNRIGKTEFAERFLASIPVLQWAKHATPEEYRRLSQYPGTHGWGGIDNTTLWETLPVLKTSANHQMLDDWESRGSKSSCSRCAVVGNGGILKDSKKGKEIDEHDYVFRTNGAIIKGFEEDVGSRTTHYTFSTNTLMNSMRSYAGAGYKGPPVSKETRYVFLPDHDRDYLLMKAAATHTPVQKGRDQGANPMKYFGEDVSVEKLKMYHPDFVRYLRNRFLRSKTMNTKYRNIYRPSTGATMLLAALHSCDQVSAYGFMTPDFDSYSDHYYDSTFHKVGFYANHDLRMELSLWQQLHNDGLMHLYMRQGDAAL